MTARVRPRAPPRPAAGRRRRPRRRQGREPRGHGHRAGAAGARRASSSPPRPAAPTSRAAGPAGLDEEIRAHLRRRSRSRWAAASATPPTRCWSASGSGAPVSMPGMMDTILNLGPQRARPRAGLATVTGDAGVRRRLPRPVHRACSPSIVGTAEVPDGPVEPSCARPSRRCSAPGTASGRRPTAPSRASPTSSAPPSPCRRWSSATGAATRAPACCSPATPPPASRRRSVTSCSARRARTSSPAPTTPSRSRSWTSARPRWPRTSGGYAEALERHYADMCDIEFTIEQGALWMLQVRAGKRSPQAALRMAVDMAADPDFPLTRERGASRRVLGHLADPPTTWAGRPGDLGRAHHAACRPPPAWRTGADRHLTRRGHRAAPATASAVILVRSETSPEDVPAMAQGGRRAHLPRRAGQPRRRRRPRLGHPRRRRRRRGRARRRRPSSSAGARYAVGDDAHARRRDRRGVRGRGRRAPRRSPPRPRRCWPGPPSSASTVPATTEATRRGTERGRRRRRPRSADDDVLRLAAHQDHLRRRRPRRLRCSPPRTCCSPSSTGSPSEGLLGRGGRARCCSPRPAPPAPRSWRRPTGTGWGAGPAAAALDDFLPLDQRMKTTVTAWQMREVDGEQVLNDHTDEDYDASVLARAGAAARGHRRPGWRRSATAVAAVPRRTWPASSGPWRPCGPATRRFVASPRVDSYHTVWFELHEDLIRLAGRTREDEVAAGRA